MQALMCVIGAHPIRACKENNEMFIYYISHQPQFRPQLLLVSPRICCPNTRLA